jgi:CubicO group peptidase (beta-lactamase class C family)
MMAASEVDHVLARAIADGTAAGLVALAADDHGVIYEGAFGSCAIDQHQPMRLDTVVKIASMTKPVTSVAAMQLVEEGRIGLDEPLGTYLPELGAIQVLTGFDATGEPRLRSPRRPITLRHLLTHTAGFAYHIWNADILRYLEHTGIPAIDQRQKATLAGPLVCDPGDRWVYGISTDWVGQTVERLSGESLEDFCRQRLFTPLGMQSTGFVLRPELQPRLAARHARQTDGSLQVIAVEEPPHPEFLEGGGGLYSTGPDYLRFLRMLLGNGQLDGARVLRPETVANMSRNQIGELTVDRLTTALPFVSNSVEFFPGMVKKWGLGLMITTEETPTGRAAGSLAWGGIANTYFGIDPIHRVTGVLMTQILPFADARVLDLLARFERAIYASRD